MAFGKLYMFVNPMNVRGLGMLGHRPGAAFAICYMPGFFRVGTWYGHRTSQLYSEKVYSFPVASSACGRGADGVATPPGPAGQRNPMATRLT